MTKLYIFDDGAIDGETKGIYPHVLGMMKALQKEAHVALVSNQTGPAIRDADKPWGEKYLSLAEVENAFADITRLGVKVYICLVARNMGYIEGWTGPEQKYLRPNGLPADDRRLSIAWLLPNTGMIDQAMKDVGATLQETVLVGDGAFTHIAARKKGLLIVSAHQLLCELNRTEFSKDQFDALFGLIDGAQANGVAITQFVCSTGLDGAMIVSCTGVGTFAISIHGNTRKIS